MLFFVYLTTFFVFLSLKDYTKLHEIAPVAQRIERRTSNP